MSDGIAELRKVGTTISMVTSEVKARRIKCITDVAA